MRWGDCPWSGDDHLVGSWPTPAHASPAYTASHPGPPQPSPAVGRGAEVPAQEVHGSLFPMERYFQIANTEDL